MTTYVPSYLRPLSQLRTGNQSRVGEKAEQVEAIRYPEFHLLAFEQHETVNLWVNEQAYHGKTKVTSGKEIRADKTVDHPSYACENVLLSGKYGEKDQLIAENTAMSEDQAKKWRNMVNRVKHPDKGVDVDGILDRGELEMPSLRVMRRTVNTVLKQEMN
jgi:hypothetical protein